MFFLPCGHIVEDSTNRLRVAAGSNVVYCWSCARWFDVSEQEQPESVREFVQRCEAWETDRETL